MKAQYGKSVVNLINNSYIDYMLKYFDLKINFTSIFLPFIMWLLEILNILFIFREGKEEGNINVWLPLARPLLGTWPDTQACALTGNRTSNPLVHRPVLNSLSYASQELQLLKLCDLDYIPTGQCYSRTFGADRGTSVNLFFNK